MGGNSESWGAFMHKNSGHLENTRSAYVRALTVFFAKWQTFVLTLVALAATCAANSSQHLIFHLHAKKMFSFMREKIKGVLLFKCATGQQLNHRRRSACTAFVMRDAELIFFKSLSSGAKSTPTTHTH